MEFTTPDSPNYQRLPHYDHPTWWGQLRSKALAKLDENGLSRFGSDLRHGGRWNLDAHWQVLTALEDAGKLIRDAQLGPEGRQVANWLEEIAALSADRGRRQTEEIRRAMTGSTGATWSEVS